MNKSFAVLLCLSGALLPRLTALDPGGVSIDFYKNIGEKQSNAAALPFPGGNFDSKEDFAKWRGGHWVHIGAKDGDYLQLLKTVRPFISRTFENQTAVIRTTPGLHKIRNNKGKGLMVSNYLEQKMPVKPGRYLLRWECKGTHDKGPSYSGFLIYLMFQDKAGKTLRQATTVCQITPNMHKYELSGLAPEGTVSAKVTFRFYGAGEVVIDSVQLAPQVIKTGITAKLNPFAFLDNTFVLPEKMACPVQFGLRNDSGKKDGDAAFYLRLPESFEVLAARVGNSLTKVDARTWRVDLTHLRKFAPVNRYSTTNIVVNLMIRANKKASAKKYTASYWVTDGKVKGQVERFDLQVKSVVNAAQPKHFKTGFCPMNDMNYSAENTKFILPLLRSAGFNGTLYIGPGMVKGVRTIGYEVYAEAVANGYRIGPNPKPDYALFRGADGKPLLTPGTIQNICPVEVYKKGKYYTGRVIPYFRSLMKNVGYDHLMANWEPFMFVGKGCFCSRCKEEFIRYSKLPKTEIDSLWGKALLEKHGSMWEKFRSYQHGLLVKTLNETMNQLGKEVRGKESYFIPAIAYTAFTKPKDHSEYALEDYAEHLQWVEPWGPYIYHKYSEPYQEYCGWNIVTHLAAKKMYTMINKYKKPPKMIAFPHAYQGSDWVTEPELIAFETLLFFVNRFHGSFAYLFPMGYDYRYWSELAKANRIIATLENVVLNSTDAKKSVTVKSITPMPAANPPVATVSWNTAEGLEDPKKVPLLQYEAFRHCDQLLIALGNFWKNGENFSRVSINGLKNGRYTVYDPVEKILFGTFTAQQLAKGILMQTGAVRWRFLMIEPQRKINGRTISQKQMLTIYRQRLPRIRKNFQIEKKRQDAHFTVNNNYDVIKPVTSYGLTMRAAKDNGKNVLQLNAPRYSLYLDAEQGGVIRNWIWKDGTVLAGKKGPYGFGHDSFLAPKVLPLASQWKIAGIRQDLEGVTVILQYRVGEGTDAAYGGLDFQKTIAFTPDKIRITMDIRNMADQTRNFVYRSHNLPSLLNSNKGKGAIVRSGKAVFERNRTITALYCGKASKQAMRVYPVKRKLNGGSNVLTVTAPWNKLILKGQFTGKIGAYAFWDEPGMTCSSLEAVFEEYTLKKNEKITLQTVWSVSSK